MKRRVIVIGSIGLALAWAAGVALAQGIEPVKESPAGTTVVKAFSKPDAACRELMEWGVEASAGNWVDVGIEWIAVDEATAQNNWNDISYVITVDGQEIVDPKSYTHGPGPATVVCPDFTLEGGGMALNIYLPPLPVGDHQVTWQVIFDADVNDGWGDYPAVTVAEFTSTVRVAPVSLPETGGNTSLTWALIGILAGGAALLAGLSPHLRRVARHSR
jgi:hypothetical protein